MTPGALSIFRGPIVWFNGATGDATAEGAGNANSKTIRLDLDAFYFMGAATRLYFRCNACVGCNPVSTDKKLSTDVRGTVKILEIEHMKIHEFAVEIKF